MLGPVVSGHALGIAATLRRNLHLTTSGCHFAAPLRCAMDAFGAERILFSVDHSFGSSAQATSFLRSVALDPGDRERIAHGNAEALLGV